MRKFTIYYKQSKLTSIESQKELVASFIPSRAIVKEFTENEQGCKLVLKQAIDYSKQTDSFLFIPSENVLLHPQLQTKQFNLRIEPNKKHLRFVSKLLDIAPKVIDCGVKCIIF